MTEAILEQKERKELLDAMQDYCNVMTPLMIARLKKQIEEKRNERNHSIPD